MFTEFYTVQEIIELFFKKYNDVVPKPRTPIQHLINNFLIRTNIHLQTTLNNKANTGLQTFRIHKYQKRKIAFRLFETLVSLLIHHYCYVMVLSFPYSLMAYSKLVRHQGF